MAMLLVKVAVNAAISYGLGLLAQSLAPTQKVSQEGSRLSEVQVTSSTEGSTIKRLYGTTRLGGQIIWATRFKETKTVTKEEQGGGKGGGGGGTEIKTTTYTYSVSFAVALCEGSDRTTMGRIWIDGKLLDQSKHTIRFYNGGPNQDPDPFIEAKEGAGLVPAFRGTCYVVFEEFELENFGNRMPQINVEVTKPIEGTGSLMDMSIQGVSLIPGAGEFVYATETYLRDDGNGNSEVLNVHNSRQVPNIVAALDQLEQGLPNCESVLLVVSWFGSSIDVNICELEPKVEDNGSTSIIPRDWRVTNLTRTTANEVSRINGGPAYGGTPSDHSVRQAVANLQARGKRVIFYPFIMMDVQANWDDFVSAWSADGYSGEDYFGATIPTDTFAMECNSISVETGSGLIEFYNSPTLNYYVLPFLPLFDEDELTPVGHVRVLIEHPTGFPTHPDQAAIEAALSTPGTRIVMNSYNWQESTDQDIEFTIISSDIRPPGTTPLPSGVDRFYVVDMQMQGLSGSFPWRGRITLADPDDDQTSAAATQVGNFVGTVDNSDYGDWNGTQLPYSGPTEWSYRRMILHYANLLKDVLENGDAFIIGSEMVGCTTIRSDANSYPFVDALVDLAADVSSVLPSNVLVSYAADWTEYHSHRPNDGSDDVYFNMDPLWASNHIDFVGIDGYFPLADWRDGTAHLDYDEDLGHTTQYTREYLKSNVEGGELYDWYYASSEDRISQTRTPIVDSAEGKHWVFRQKDIRNWWSHLHYNRPGGTESGSPTAWNVKDKPVWFTEFGCPAVDKGANQPNVFVDPKSSESFIPYFSSGVRDDLAQRSYIEAMLEYWREQGSELTDMEQLALALGWSGSGEMSAHVTRIRMVDYGDYTMHITTTGVGTETGGAGHPWQSFSNHDNGNAGMTFSPDGSSESGYFGGTIYRPTGVSADSGEAAFSAALLALPGDYDPSTEIWLEFEVLPGRWFRFTGEVSEATSNVNTTDVLDGIDDYQTCIGFHGFTYIGEQDPDIGPIQTANMHVWTWDARPYPEFPYRSDIWSDAPNWQLGHWINGRIGSVPLGELVKTICGLVGIEGADIDVSGLFGTSGTVRGYLVEDIRAPREMLQDLSIGYTFDGFESQGKLKFSFRSNTTDIPLALDNLVSTKDNPGGYTITRAQETEMPSVIKLSFIDEENDFNVGGADARTMVGYAQSVESVSLPLVLPQQYVRALGDVFIQEAWLQRDTAELILPNSWVRLDPSDSVVINIKDREMRFRLAEIEAGNYREITGVSHDPSVYALTDYNGRAVKRATTVTFGRAKASFLDIPMVTGREANPHAPRIAVYQNPWPGGVAIYEDDAAGGFEVNTVVGITATMGELPFDFYSGPTGRWDTVNELYVDLYDPDSAFFSSTDEAVYAGANTIAIQNQNGEWEVVQFVTATPLGDNRYMLTRLLRGQLGTERQMLNPTNAGGRVVLLQTGTLGILDLTMSELDEPKLLRYGPAPIAVGDFRFRSETHTFQGVGLRPYAPVSLKATRVYGGSNDLTLSWIRRTRFGGDAWGKADVPLNEEFEKYEVDIMTGSTILRTIKVSNATEVVYTAAQQTADFGSAPASIKFRVYQMSAIYGRGSRAEHNANAIYL